MRGSAREVPEKGQHELLPNVRVHHPGGCLVGPSVTSDGGGGDGVAGGRHLVAAVVAWWRRYGGEVSGSGEGET